MSNPGATAAANHGIGIIITELVKHIKEWKNVREDCNQLRREFDICVAFRQDVIQRGDSKQVARTYDKEVRELAHDIEDCIERFMYRITCKDEARWHHRTTHAIRTWCMRWRFAKEMKKLNKRSEKAGVDQIRRLREEPTTSAPPEVVRCFTRNPVCIDQAKQELLTLLDTVGTEPTKLRVIAIVGFGGSGKTTLAHAVYESARGFPLRAWVERTEYTDACALLKIIIEKFWPEEKDTVAAWSNEKRIGDHLTKLLKQKRQRYLIVLDDMNMNHWGQIEGTFYGDGTRSRIMVTVRTLPAANDITSNQTKCNGYVYKMRTLGIEGSKTIASLTELPDDDTETLRKKCDGLPLALVSVAGHFRRTTNRGRPTNQECKELCNKLGSFLHDSNPHPVATDVERDPFEHLRDVLMNNYASLTSWTLRNSLLYLGIFPDAQHLMRNKITRRWVAEGYAPGYHPRAEQKKAYENFQLLVDRNIIQLVGISTGIQHVGISTGRMCRAPGIVREFVLHKSMSENFIWTIDAAEQSSASTRNQRHKRVRHFVVRGSNTICSRAAVNMDLTHIRSLTVQRVTNNGDNLGSGGAGQGGGVGHRSGSEGDGFFKFSKYKVIRVLDLEECTEVKNSHMESICKLWNLRYLTLGGEVNEVPKEISQLNLLERLHLSKTVVTKLPADIIRMTSLIHLSGKFLLPESELSTELVEESKQSKLETLSGIVASKTQGFLLLVPQMKKLRKVKICYGRSGEPILGLRKPLLDAIIGYLKRALEHEVPRRLCLDFRNLYATVCNQDPESCMEDLYGRLSSDGNYYLTSLKLHLKQELESSMPEFIVLLSGLKKLCLSLTSVTQDLLSYISKNLHMLAHLKLKADRIHRADLVIHEGTFQWLETLRFIVKEDGSIPPIHIQGTLPQLRSFQLLCENLADDRCGININRLEKLQEIELHVNVRMEARQQWETAARNHPNRPNVLPFLHVDDPAGTAIPAAGAPQFVDGMPAAVAAANTTGAEGAPLEIHGPAEHQVASASMAVDEPVDGMELNEVGNAARVDQEPAVADSAEGGDKPTELISSATTTSIQPTEVPFAGCAPVRYEPAEVLASSAPANDESPNPANSVGSATSEDNDVSPEDNMPNMLVLNNNGLVDEDKAATDANKPSESPIDRDEATPGVDHPTGKEVSGSITDKTKRKPSPEPPTEEDQRKLLKSRKDTKKHPLISDFERQTRKGYSKSREEAERGTKAAEELQKDADAAGLSVELYIKLRNAEERRGTVETSKTAYQFKLGDDLVEGGEEALKQLPTQMGQVHEWYKAVMTGHPKQYSFGVRVPPEVYLQEKEDITWIEFASLFQLYQQRELDVQIMSLFTVMMYNTLNEHNIKDIAFLDPVIVNEHNCKGDNKTNVGDIVKAVEKVFLQVENRKTILLAYQCSFHYVLLEIKLEQSRIRVYDSKRRKPVERYISHALQVLNEAFRLYRKQSKFHSPFWKDFQVEAMDKYTLYQADGNNLCGWYVMWAMWRYTKDDFRIPDSVCQEVHTQELLQAKIIELSEQLCAFIFEKVFVDENSVYNPSYDRDKH